MTASGPPVRPPRTASRPQRKALVLAFLISVAIVPLLLVAGFLFLFLLAFSVGTGWAAVDVDTLVLDRETRAPVPGCLLAFQPGSGPEEYPQTTERTDARGRVRWRTDYSWVGTVLNLLYRPERSPSVWFYVGEARSYRVRGRIENWRMWLRFREPWRSGREVVPRVQLERSLFSEELLNAADRGRAFEPLPSVPADRLVNAVVRVESDPEGHTSYRVALTVLLDRDQIAVCQGPSGRREALNAAAHLFNAKRYAEAHEAYREAARSWPEEVWPWTGMADSLYRVNRKAEAVEAHRKAVEMAPNDADAVRACAFALLGENNEEAEMLFQKVLVLEPEKASAHIGLGYARSNLERYTDALASFATARQLCASCLDDRDREVEAKARRLARHK